MEVAKQILEAVDCPCELWALFSRRGMIPALSPFFPADTKQPNEPGKFAIAVQLQNGPPAI